MNNYIIYEEMGKGKFSVVHKGRKKKTQEFVTLKSFDKTRKNRVFNEVKIIHNLNHPNILRFQNWYETRNHYWIIYEYCSGGDLRTVIQSDKTVLEKVIRSNARDMSCALMYLHSNGIVFCDLKPTNIIINEYSNLKICDFAVAQKIVDMIQNTQQSKVKRGAPNYMAPELFEEDGVYSFSSDIYAFGCILYEMAKGTPPFYSDKFQELASKICNETYEPIGETYSSEFSDFISICLNKNPAKRATWAVLKKHPWWKGFKLPNYDIPNEPHFEEFLKFKGYLNEPDAFNKEGAIIEANKTQHKRDSDNPDFIQTSDLVNKMKSDKVSNNKGRTSNNEANLMRLSLNVQKNMLKENSDYLGIIDNKDVKLKNVDEVIDMGENVEKDKENKKNNEGAVDNIEDEDFTKSVNDTTKSPHQTIHSENNNFYKNNNSKSNIDVHEKSNISTFSTKENAKDKSSYFGKSIHDKDSQIGKTSQKSIATNNQAKENLKKEFLVLQPYLIHQTDRIVKPIIGNVEIEKLDDFPFFPELPPEFRFLSIDEFKNLDKEGFESYLTSLYKYAVAQCPMKEKQNILHYFIRFIQSSDNANIIIESFFMDLFQKMLKLAKTQSFKIALCTIIGLLLRYTTVVNNDLAKQGIMAITTELTKDKNMKVKRRAIAALGEYIFYGATQLDGTSATEMWDIPTGCINLLMKQIKTPEDEIIRLYALKAIENITSQSELGGSKFCFPELTHILLGVLKENQGSGISGAAKVSAAVILTNIGSLQKEYLPEIIKKIGLKNIINGLKDGEKRVQQAFLTILNLYIYYCGESACKEIQENFKNLFQILMNFLEQNTPPIVKSKSLLMIIFLGMNDFSVQHYAVDGKFMMIVDKLFQEKNKNVQQVLEKLVDLFKKHIIQFLHCINEELSLIIQNVDEELDDQEDQENTNTEIIIGGFNFICNTFASTGMQNKILGEKQLAEIFDLFQYITGPIVSKYSDIYSLMLMLFEQISSNKIVLLNNSDLFLMQILPNICKYMKTDVYDTRFTSQKLFTDLFAQIVFEPKSLNKKNEEFTFTLLNGGIVPMLGSLMEDDNPIGTYAIKLSRFMIEFNRLIVKRFKRENLLTQILSYFTSEHEKCNANTFKLQSCLLESDDIEMNEIDHAKFLETCSILYERLEDIQQGEELLELIMAFYRKVFLAIQINEYSIEAVQPHKSLLKQKMGNYGTTIANIYKKSMNLLMVCGGVDLTELVECQISGFLLLNGLEQYEQLDTEKLSTTFMQQLLKTLLKENIDLNTKELIGHFIHLLCKTTNGLQQFMKEKELREKVRRAIEQDPKWREQPVSTIFDNMYGPESN